MDNFQAKKKLNKIIGNYGETIAANFLKNKGFTILQRNYLKKWGEIDIVTRRTEKIHFIEVKTVSYETKKYLESDVSRDTWHPESNIHPKKLKRIHKTIESWLLENNYQADWQLDAITVKLVFQDKYAVVKHITNIII